MFRNFQDVLEKAQQNKQQMTISVAAAQDQDVLLAIKKAIDIGFAKAILVGDAESITPMLAEVGLPIDTPIVHEPDIQQAGMKAVALVKAGKAQVLMKGLLNSSDFLRAVIHPQEGLRTGRLLSHLACLSIPGEERLLFISDGGMNIAPSLNEKKDILTNALLALQNTGIAKPKVALLTANEVVNPKMPATVDAQELVKLCLIGEMPACEIEGPIAMDVALSPDAARHKGINSNISGKVDLFIVPNIETGNAVSKTLIYYSKAQMAGIVLGATNPIVMTSRAETPEGKLYSIALACLAANPKQ